MGDSEVALGLPGRVGDSAVALSSHRTNQGDGLRSSAVASRQAPGAGGAG